MPFDELNFVERPALGQLHDLGWGSLNRDGLSPENDNHSTLKDVVLMKRLELALKRINPWINDNNLLRLCNDLTGVQYSDLIGANQTIWKSLVNYISVKQDVVNGSRSQTVKIIDFDNVDNNDFLCVCQFKVSGTNQNIIPDIVLFVNGLPLAVIECKSPSITNPIETGIDQLLMYANRRNPHENEGAERLFYYNQLMVSTCMDKARVGTITSRMEHYLEWKEPYLSPVTSKKPTSQELLIAGLFNRRNFLDLIQNFTVFDTVDGRTVKKIARYQQFRAVHKSIKRIKTGTDRKSKSGVNWHTQGSGKSLTMVFFTLKARRDPELQKYKLVFITDRIQLDQQLKSTFQNVQSETIYHANSVKELKELLQKDASDIVMTTVQKFQETAEDCAGQALNESDKIIVIADEAHRTQYGSLGAAINAGLPYAPKIAFTGTPLIKTGQTTNEFGSYIDRYTIEQSVADGATVQILYEGREAKVNVTRDSLDSLFAEYFGDKTVEEQAAIKRKYGTEKAVLEAPQRIRRVCIDILKHYREHIQPNGFKALVVTSSRHAAITYKEKFDELNAPESAVVISGKHTDGKRFKEHSDGSKHRVQIENFKKPLGTGEGHSNLSILIVKDMLLTGFDAPIAQVMYLDRKLTDHTLLQAIARVNRTNKGKNRGYIVDYYGLSDYLTEALEMFSAKDIAGVLPELKDEIPKLQNFHTRVMSYFKGLDLADSEACACSLNDEIRRQTFQQDFAKFARQMDIVLPAAVASPFIPDLRKLGKIAHRARNMYRDEQLSVAGAGKKVRQLIEEHIVSTGVDPKISPVDLLDKDFKERLNEHKSAKAKALEIESAIRHHIKIRLADDPVHYKSLAEKLEAIIREHEEKWEELVQLLLDFGEEIEVDRDKRAAELGLTTKESPYYNVIESELMKIDENGNINKTKITAVVRKLVATIEEATAIVDFFTKANEQKKLKLKIKRELMEEISEDRNLVKNVSDEFIELAKNKHNDFDD